VQCHLHISVSNRNLLLLSTQILPLLVHLVPMA